MGEKRIVLYPGTFDPVTNGHVGIVRRGLALFDTVCIAVAGDTPKATLFTLEERVAMIRETFASEDRVVVQPYVGLTVQFARSVGACAMLRGLRSMSDFDYEFMLARANKRLACELETVFFIADSSTDCFSSRAVREFASHGASVVDFVPECVVRKLEERFAPSASQESFDPDRLVNQGRC
ncbi:MAG: pantetheine-phosphate adenylyltransferase [Desulfovibrionaceae bacterium]|nr:pantetheine-phosphate adenylyltransferase [Desulfovibrionaceae bacterium]